MEFAAARFKWPGSWIAANPAAMPAIPAWPPKTLPRLYVRQPLSECTVVELDRDQANYLGNVMRLGQGAELLVFHGSSGEWVASVADAGKKRMTLRVERHIRDAERVPDIWLAFAPVKRSQTDWLVEKATELGAARLVPVISQRTIVERVKVERLQAVAIEAAEQCGRTMLPEIAEPMPLRKFVEQHQDRTLYFADEQGGQSAATGFEPGPATILTGPEGGFTDEERALVRDAPNAKPISLGPRILRAETAALAALSSWMALAGDWRT